MIVGVGIFRLPTFAVSEVEVWGLRELSEASLLERAPVHGRNILVLPVDQLRTALTQDPWIRRVDIQRYLPGRVAFYVEEREPAVVWQVGDRQFLVDRDGTVLQEAERAQGLPLVKDLDGPPPRPGERPYDDAVALALSLTQAIPREMGQEADFFEYLSHEGMAVQTKQGERARFGDSSSLLWKLKVWKVILAEGEAQKLDVGHVDLRFGDRPFFRQ